VSGLSAEGLAIERGGRVVASNLSFAWPAGSFVAVLGTNGTGKTSLLRVLSGEIPPAAGRVLYAGRDVRSLSSGRLSRMRSFLSQNCECRLPFAAGEIVQLGAEAAGHRGLTARNKAREAMERTGISFLAGRQISMLSGGEQQRVHWARVLAQLDDVTAGKILFMDEPVASLDLSHQHRLLAEAAGLAASGLVVVAVLHDLNLAASYANRVMLLHRGGLFAMGAPENVLIPENIQAVFTVEARLLPHPDGKPSVIVTEAPAAGRLDGEETHTGSGRIVQQMPC